MNAPGKPEVKTRKSGVRFVEPEDILRSESGLDEIRKAARHSAAMRQNRNRTRAAQPPAE
jgi:hypothetical protein